MAIRLSDLSLPLDYTEADLKRAVAAKLRLSSEEILNLSLFRRSVDARKKDRIRFICTVDLTVSSSEEKLLSRIHGEKIEQISPYHYELPPHKALPERPVVVGSGPAGLFAALLLAEAGKRPLLIERGQPVEKRTLAVEHFWKEGILQPNSNVQFGEGGAGTFSDGKLNTGTKDSRSRKVLKDFVAAGAPEEILFSSKPHIGTDRLRKTICGLRNRILALGGEVRFSQKLCGLLQKEGTLCGIRICSSENSNIGEEISTRHVILAIGHSARDTFEMLLEAGIRMEPKPFSVGARIEHRRALIDLAQYGSFAGHPSLGAADYKLAVHLKNGRGVYTFCMCPGGEVVAAASEPGRVVTNGMSEFARAGQNSNSALLVGVSPEDFGSAHPLAGVAYQRRLEEAAFALGGESFRAPAQRVEDFLSARPSSCLGEVLPSYRPGVTPSDLSGCLPEEIVSSMRQGIRLMGSRLKGFDSPNALLTGVETRSSSPVRTVRGEDFQSVSLKGLYPCGEGAGYAGGIISAAVDGIRCAEAVLLSSL